MNKGVDSRTVGAKDKLLDYIIYYNINTSSLGNDTTKSKREYTYTVSGNQEYYIDYFWNKCANKWQPTAKRDEKLDDRGNVLVKADYSWDALVGVWKGKFYKVEYVYNDSGKVELQTYYRWDSNYNDWVGSWKNEFTYDSLLNITSDVKSKWDRHSNLWLPDEKKEIHWMDGQRVADRSFSWNSDLGEWQIEEQTKFQYQEDGTILNHVTDQSSVAGEWIGAYKSEFRYENNDRNLEVTAFENPYVYTDKVVWDPERKYEIAYDENGNTVYSHSSVWNKSTRSWDSGTVIENAYDSFGRLSSKSQKSYNIGSYHNFTGSKTDFMYSRLDDQLDLASYEWNRKDSVWMPSLKHEYTFDRAGFVTKKHQFIRRNDEWQNNQISHYFYSDAELADEVFSLNRGFGAVNVLSNPTKNVYDNKYSSLSTEVDRKSLRSIRKATSE
ncbi:hypothetical protein [Marinoscillum sp. MHG1-6]|uniref:hypothetical protein n=1 Tax=Marinoscillum sp. MHG1-6 TaxID=2959627 RepID=UPI002157BA82|nr:hypothetical protein [Marinoscillum sp. MHG1-6]